MEDLYLLWHAAEAGFQRNAAFTNDSREIGVMTGEFVF